MNGQIKLRGIDGWRKIAAVFSQQVLARVIPHRRLGSPRCYDQAR